MKFTTVCGAARLLGVAPMTIYRYIEQGLLDVIESKHYIKMVLPDQVRLVMDQKRVGRPRTKKEDDYEN